MRKSVLMLLATLLLAGCNSDNQTPKQALLPSKQVTTTPVALQLPTAATRADFARNWFSAEATKQWTHEIELSTGGNDSDMLILYFKKESAEIASQVASSAEFSRMMVQVGFKNVLVLRLFPGDQPGPDFRQNQIAYIGTVSQNGVKWVSKYSSSSRFVTVTQESPRQQPAQASSTELAHSGIVVNKFYSGMTWDEGSGVMSTGHKALCKNSGGLGADIRYTKSCKIHYGDLDTGGPSGYSVDTMLMFYRDRLYMINSNRHSVSTQKEITLAFGKPQSVGDEGSCWYRGEVLYQVNKNGGKNDTDTVEVVDFNYAPPSLRAQRKGNPMCGGILAN